ncbi:MAG: DUF2933 domain-containing protein [Myxococcales bacterium]|nr:DUF2933 domain-containing protein [Myxococcales bacterium]
MVEHATKTRFGIPVWLAAGAFLAIAVSLLWAEHEAHILGALPYLILLACPLIHIFMHRGHGHGGHGGQGHSHGDHGGQGNHEKGGRR